MKTRIGHPYLMYESIMSTPDMLRLCLQKKIRSQVKVAAQALITRGIKRVILTGCGTSMIVAQGCVHFFAQYTNLDVVTDSAYELLNYPVVRLRDGDAVIGFSHTGGTKAVVDYLKKCRQDGYLTLGILEVENSPLEQAAEVCIVGPGGKDEATPKTRSFSTGLLLGLLLAMHWSELRGRPVDWSVVEALPNQAQAVLASSEPTMHQLAEEWKMRNKFVLVGSGTEYITAKEISLKLMEAANVTAMGVQIEELAHGNELMLDSGYGVVLIAPKGCRGIERLCHDINGIACIGADLVLLVNEPNLVPNDKGRVITILESTDELLAVFLFILPLQLFAYYSTVVRGLHPDLAAAVRPEMQLAIREFHPPGYH